MKTRTAPETLTPKTPLWRTSAVWMIAAALIAGAVWFAVDRHGSDHHVTVNRQPTTAPRHLMPARVVSETIGVPEGTLQQVGAPNNVAYPFELLRQPPLTIQGKPAVFFAGADYCSYCGAVRWALVQAMSRFGNFSNLSLTESAPSETFPKVQSYSFYPASYESQYISFSPVEIYDNVGIPRAVGSYYPLQTPTKDQQRLIDKYDVGSVGPDDGLPLVDFGNRYFLGNSQFSPKDLQGLTVAQIGKDLADPSSKVANDIDGSANILTGALCMLTNDQPSSVCAAPEITPIVQRYEHPATK